MRVCFHGLQTPGPVASESASARAASRSSTSALPSRVSTTRLTVAGSSRSRRVAVCGSSRWWRTIAPRRATSGSGKPSRRPICTARASPTTEWSPPRPLPMSCSRVPTSSRSGPAHPRGQPRHLGAGLHQVPVDRPDVRAVARWQVPHGAPLGEQPPPQPRAVQRLHHVDERVAGAQQRQQLVQSRPRPRLAQLGGGVGEPVQGARRDRQPGAGRRGRHPQHQAGIAAGRRVPGQRDLPARARRHRCRAGAAPVPGAAPRARAAATRRAPTRSPTSAANATARAAPDRALASSKRSPSSSTRGDLVRVLRAQDVAGPPGEPVQLGADVEQQRRAPPAPRPPDGRRSWAAASASRSWTSRSPPWPFFRSGSTRWATSPTFAQRSWAPSESSSNRLRMPARHAWRTAPATFSDSSESPAMCRASSSPNAARRSVAATCTAWPGRADGVVQPDAGVPERVPEPRRRAARRPAGRRAAGPGRDRSTAPARGGRALRPPRARPGR